MSEIKNRPEFMVSFNYKVEINSSIIGFSKVSNIEQKIETEVISEGGNNDYPYVFAKPKSGTDTLMLEKGVLENDEGQFNNLLKVGLKINSFMLSVLKQDGSSQVSTFTFANGIITKVKYSDLDALQGNILIATLEIAHSGLMKV